MADKNLSYEIRVSDGGSVKRTDEGVKGLTRSLSDAVDAARGFESVRLNNLQQALGSISSLIGSVCGKFRELTSAYEGQIVAETQLATVMRQRMGAVGADIDGIKALCSAQQELGVVGDEVQLSGAQQMATFLSETSSLATLIPAMNNLIAQQEGLNATQQSATSIGNMMGKAMQGQTEVLQRVGITFTEAQAAVLKYGSEAERAAMLAEVIKDNVGEMNSALAGTDAGCQQQLNNILGDIKETLGGCVQGMQPFVEFAGMTAMAASGALQFAVSLKAVNAAQALTATWSGIVTGAVKAWQVAQAGLNLVLTANPIGVVVMAIGGLVAAAVAAYRNFEPFRNVVDEVWSAVKELGSAVWNWLEPAFEKLSATVKTVWGYLKKLFGWDDPAKGASESLRREERDVRALEKAYGDLGGKRSVGSGASSSSKPGSPAAGVPSYAAGSIGGMEAEIRMLEERLKGLTDHEQRVSLAAEIWLKKESLNGVQKELDELSRGLELKATWRAVGGTDVLGGVKQGVYMDGGGGALNMDDIGKRGAESMKRYQKQLSASLKASDERVKKHRQSMVDAFGGVGDAFGALADATGVPLFAGLSKAALLAEAIAVMVSKLWSCVTVWDYIAAIGGGTAAVISAFASMPSFADGALVYGPTVALTGEYAGAGSNPEVIAPLNKLRGLIAESGAGRGGGEVVFRISGTTLLGVLQNAEKVRGLSL